MKINKSLLAICIAIPLLVGGAAAVFSGGGMKAFGDLNQPLLSPPGWLFPVVWSVLYILMGIASYLVITSISSPETKEKALIVYAYQLVVNFLWPIFFFDFGWYFFSFIWILLLWLIVLVMLLRFYHISKAAGILIIPYLLWITFAAYLNLAIWILN